jgi:hypothetical protein
VQAQLVANITLIDDLNEPPVTKRDWLLYNITAEFAPCTKAVGGVVIIQWQVGLCTSLYLDHSFHPLGRRNGF